MKIFFFWGGGGWGWQKSVLPLEFFRVFSFQSRVFFEGGDPFLTTLKGN